MKPKTIKYCAFGLLVLIAIILATATVVEKLFGTPVAYEKIYSAWWFILLWALMAISAMAYIIKLWKKKPMSVVSLLFHLAFIIILVGALTTYLTAERGSVHIRQGETVRYYVLDDDSSIASLPFDVKLLLFDIQYHPESDLPADYISYLKVDDEVCQVSMNKIYKSKGYRLYQLSFDSDEMGTTLLVNHDPWGIGITYAGYGLLFLTMIILLFMRIAWKGVVAVAIPVAILCYYISQINPMTPILRSPMLAAHVSVIMISYLLLLLITIFSIIGLSSSKYRIKMYNLNTLFLYPALFLLTAGIFIGAIWANISWGRYWGWDAKETWALITLLIYAFPFHRRSISFFRNPKKYHIFCIFAFLSILMTFLGVSYILGGIHSYI